MAAEGYPEPGGDLGVFARSVSVPDAHSAPRGAQAPMWRRSKTAFQPSLSNPSVSRRFLHRVGPRHSARLASPLWDVCVQRVPRTARRRIIPHHAPESIPPGGCSKNHSEPPPPSTTDNKNPPNHSHPCLRQTHRVPQHKHPPIPAHPTTNVHASYRR